jgi:LysR family transcriptional regulator, hca operon transcriptional activator
MPWRYGRRYGATALRYFIPVAEEGSLTLAAAISNTRLMSRSVHGIELTAAGRAFLDHAGLALTQAEAARRAVQPAKPTFSTGFQTGQEVDWPPGATIILCDELLNIEIRVSSDHSAMLADDLQRGKLGIAFLRREQKTLKRVRVYGIHLRFVVIRKARPHLEAQRSSRIPSVIDNGTVEPAMRLPTYGRLMESHCTAT